MRKFRRQVAFTLVELLVTIGIIALLLAILFPVFAQVRAKGRESACASNLHQLGLAMSLYGQDNDDRFPLGGDPIDLNTPLWKGKKFEQEVAAMRPLPDVLNPYVKSKALWNCPSDTGFELGGETESIPFDTRPSSFTRYGSSYYYHTSLALYQDSMSNLRAWNKYTPHEERGVADIVSLYDGTGIWHGGYVINTRRYGCLFVDGHAKTLPRADFTKTFDQAFKQPTN